MEHSVFPSLSQDHLTLVSISDKVDILETNLLSPARQALIRGIHANSKVGTNNLNSRIIVTKFEKLSPLATWTE